MHNFQNPIYMAAFYHLLLRAFLPVLTADVISLTVTYYKHLGLPL